MGPRDERRTPQDDLFRNKLVNLINLGHPLVKLAERIEWSVFEQECSELFVSTTGRPAAPPRLIAGLLYLQHAYNLCDEAVLERWLDSPYFQYFCGEQYFCHELPIDPSSLTRWRSRIGEEGVELLLAETVEVARRSGVVKRQSLERVSVDTTVQEKAVSYPTDAKLYARGIKHLTKLAQRHGVGLRQSYARKAPEALLAVNRYAHAKQMKRKRRATRRLATYLGRVSTGYRAQARACPRGDAGGLRRAAGQGEPAAPPGPQNQGQAPRLARPGGGGHRQGQGGQALGVRGEGGRGGDQPRELCRWLRSMPHNPYDGHTLAETLEHSEILSGVRARRCYVDRGYRGAEIPGVSLYRSGQKRGVNTRTLKRELKRRSAIEAVIGHLKTDGRMDRCRMKGALGDALNAVLVAAGHNIRLLLRAMARLLRQILGSLSAALFAQAPNQPTPAGPVAPA